MYCSVVEVVVAVDVAVAVVAVVAVVAAVAVVAVVVVVVLELVLELVLALALALVLVVVQRRALFRHLNFQKCSEPGVLHILTWKCASRHNGVQLLISNLATRRFSEPTFRPAGATNHWKNSESRLFYLFAHLNLLSSDSFSSLIFFLLLFSSLTLPTSAIPSVHIVGSLTSKLPSIIIIMLHDSFYCWTSFSIWHRNMLNLFLTDSAHLSATLQARKANLVMT